MKKSTVTANLSSPIEVVWKAVTDNTNYAWRSDIAKIVVSDAENSFTELTKNGFATHFTITAKTLYERCEFDMENENMKGHWTGIFSKDGSGTKIEFTEEVEMIKPIMNLFVKSFLKRQQATYIADLKRNLVKYE